MKAKLLYEMPADQYHFDIAIRAAAMHSTLMELDNELRSRINHHDLDVDTQELLMQVRKTLNEGMPDLWELGQ